MSNASPTTTVAVTDAHGSALRRALRVTASEKWDLNRRFPVVLTRASGAHAWDINGRQYVDFTSCSGAAPLGAGYEPVVEHAAAEMRRTGGILPGPLSGHRIELAERLAEIFPVAERSMFFRTGSCATTAAVRLARSFTGLNHVLTSGYHGWHDWQLQDRPEMGLPNRDRDSVDFRYNLDLLDELERFPVEVNRNSQRGFPRARKSDSVLPATTCGACDGEGILQGPQGACG
ncbi:glutamate-1-semialdehyde aminotransferase [Bradyrhizobium sp. USDA 4509]